MSRCSTTAGSRPPAVCPRNGKPGRSVGPRTVRALLAEPARHRARANKFYICVDPGCPVVYYGTDGEFETGDLSVAVGFKNGVSGETVCYCFGHTRGSIREEIARTGESTVIESIKAEIKVGNCACETKNPKGTCCLGDVVEAVKRAFTGAATALLLIFLSIPVAAHEPIIGFGPHTLFKGGKLVELHLEAEAGEPPEYELSLGYGITPDFMIRADIPFPNGADHGAGDVLLRMKHRFYRSDFKGGSHALGYTIGVELPTGRDNVQGVAAASQPGSGSTDWLVAGGYGYESLKYYGFAGARYRHNTEANNFERPDLFGLDLAVGLRPWEIEDYRDWDPVFLVQGSWERKSRAESFGAPLANSGGEILYVTPGALVSLRNIMFKIGLKTPVAWDLNGVQSDPRAEAIFAIDSHW